jgi:hypothetical protein
LFDSAFQLIAVFFRQIPRFLPGQSKRAPRQG